MTIRTAIRTGIGPALMLAALAISAAATGADTSADRVQVDWSNPADFAEIKQSPGYGIGRQTPEEWLGELAKHLRTRADRALPSGEHLAVTFTDVKRAGTYEPWRGPQWDDVRIVKDIYPPSIKLRFALTSADGATLSEGERTLRDSAFLSRSLPYTRDDPLRYEKRMLDDWLRREFGERQASR